MQFLPQGQKNTATIVKWEDQEKINEFSTLTTKKELECENLTKLRNEKEVIDDLFLEMELFDDDEKVYYKYGDIFVKLKAKKAVSMIESEIEKINTIIDESEENLKNFDNKIKQLKTELYSKFGSNINLEK